MGEAYPPPQVVYAAPAPGAPVAYGIFSFF